MASSYSNSLKIQLMANGEDSNTWGTITNTNWNLIEQAVTGVDTIVMANANYTLTNLNGVSDEARNMVIIATGTTGGAGKQIVAPLVPKFYIVYNNTSDGYSVNIGASTGAVITIPNGVTAQVYCDGSNFYSAQTGSAGNFTVNGNLTATGIADTGALSAATLSVSGAATFSTSPTAPTPTTGDNTTKVATTAFVQANSVPTGSLLMWSTSSAPSGYLNCDGSAVSRSTYASLFSVVGTTFGSGDGSTTFNLPNYTNRMPYGTTIGSTGGSADAIVVSHTHTATSTVTDPGHFHSYSGQNFAGGGSGGPGFSSINSTPATNTSTATTGITVATTNQTAGSSGTGANLPPYLGINFIIKT
jgi:microcystin-dependent protein